MDRFLVSTKSISVRGLAQSPVRGIFSIQRLRDLVGMQNAMRARALQQFGYLANSLSSVPKSTDWSLTRS
jgi:hypothetical protein